MVRSVSVTVPTSNSSSTLTVLSSSSHVHGLAAFGGDGVVLYVFKVDERRRGARWSERQVRVLQRQSSCRCARLGRPAPSRVGKSLMSFMASASKTLDGSASRAKRLADEEVRRDSTDMFSPNNFAADLRNMSLSITERGGGEEEEEGDAEDVVIGGGGQGDGFFLDRDEDFDIDDAGGDDVDGEGGDPIIDPLRASKT